MNLARVSFIDSSGLNVLLRRRRALQERGIRMSVVRPADPIVRRVFEIARLGEALGLVDSLEAALA